MRHLSTRTSLLIASLCLIVILGAFLPNNAIRSQAHAAQPVSSAQSTAKKTPEPVHSAGIVNNSIYYNSDQFSTYALDTRSGSLLWRVSNTSLLTVSMGLVYVRVQNRNSPSAHIHALDPNTGALVWRSPLLQLNLTSVYPVNGVLYVVENADYNVPASIYALSGEQGSLLWSYTTAGGLFSTPLFADHTMYISVTNRGNGTIYAFNADTGATFWQYPQPNVLKVADGIVYADSSSGVLYGLKASDGSLLWQYDTKQTAALNSLGSKVKMLDNSPY